MFSGLLRTCRIVNRIFLNQIRMSIFRFTAGDRGNCALARRILSEGVVVVRNAYDKEALISLEDSIVECEGHYWNDEIQSDLRKIVRHPKGVGADFLHNGTFSEIAKLVQGPDAVPSYIVFGQTRFVDGNLGSGGGWHRDSWGGQFKVIVYLSEVEPGNGGFELIPRTNQFLPKLLSALRYGWHERNLRITGNINQGTVYLGSAGDMLLVDTSCIHRGSPLLTGSRKALTIYYS